MDFQFAQQLHQKTRADYDAIADSWNVTRDRVQSDTMQLFKTLVTHGASVVDIGCGNGRLIDAIRVQRCMYTGVDVSTRLLDIARNRYPEYKDRFIAGDVLLLPLPNASFDILAMISVLHHIPSAAFRQQAMKECYRVLRPGGVCFISNWNVLHPMFMRRYRTWRLFFKIMKPGFDRRDILIPWKRDVARPVMRYIHVFRAAELRRLCAEAGFTSVECFYTLHGKRAHWWNGSNLVTIARK